MKHLVKNNEVVMSGIPGHFTRENGEAFWGSYDKRVDLHYADGWRNEEKPEIDPTLEQLGEPYYDEVNDIVKFPVKAKALPPIEEVQAQRKLELGRAMDEFTTLISRAKLMYEGDAGLIEVIETIKGVKDQTVNDINTLDVAALIKYRIKQEDIDYLKGLLEPYLL